MNSRSLYRMLEGIYEELGRDDEKFSDALDEELDKKELGEILEGLFHVADQYTEEEGEEGCLKEAVSDIQREAAEFVESAFDQLREHILGFDADIGGFPFFVQRNEEEVLFMLSEEGEICLLDPEDELPGELFEQDMEGFITIEAPEPIGRLRFIPVIDYLSGLAGMADEVRLEDGSINLPVFAELSEEQRRQESLVWNCTGNPDRDEALEELIANRSGIANVDEPASVPGNRGMTPLMQAAASQSSRFVELLIDMGAYVNAVDEAGYSPLTYAVQGKNRENLLLLLEKDARVDPIPSGEGRYSPLALASDNGLADMVGVLIEKGADVDWSGENGETAVKYAAAGGCAECLEKLIEAGADPIAYDDEGFSPIHNAADNVNVRSLELLLKAGVEVDLPIAEGGSDEGRTALNRACAMGHLEAVRFLVDHGAMVNREFPDGATCLSSTMAHPDDFDEERQEIVKLLLDRGGLTGISVDHLAMVIYTALLAAPASIVGRVLKAAASSIEQIGDPEHGEACRNIVNRVLEAWMDKEEDRSRRREVQQVMEDLGVDWIEMPMG